MGRNIIAPYAFLRPAADTDLAVVVNHIVDAIRIIVGVLVLIAEAALGLLLSGVFIPDGHADIAHRNRLRRKQAATDTTGRASHGTHHAADDHAGRDIQQ